jgi:hypothetical protein
MQIEELLRKQRGEKSFLEYLIHYLCITVLFAICGGLPLAFVHNWHSALWVYAVLSPPANRLVGASEGLRGIM